MSSNIDYPKLMDRALRGLVKDALSTVAENGLPGDHHFYIVFDTKHPDVAVAGHLLAQYPEEMTIVMQHWFDHLEVGEEGFSVTLSFDNLPEPLYIPYESILSFMDPSVQFGLRFSIENEDESKGGKSGTKTKSKSNGKTETDGKSPKNAEVVNLDSFRKKSGESK